MSTAIQNKLRLPLFMCRFGVLIVFVAWWWDKIFNARHGAGIFNKYYHLPFEVNEQMIVAAGILQMAFILVIFLGLFKRITRGMLMFFSGFTTFIPLLLNAYAKFFDPSNFVLDRKSGVFLEFFLLPTVAMFVCAIIIYVLRDYDTMFSLNKNDRKLEAAIAA